MALKMNDLISLKSHHGKYLVAEADGRLNANRDRIGSWEKFTILDPNNTASTREVKYGDTISLRSYHGKYVVAEADGRANANRDAIGEWEKWTILDPNNPSSRAIIPDDGKIALKSFHGKYMVAEANHTVNANRDAIGAWEIWAIIKGAVVEEKIDAAQAVSNNLPSSMIAGSTYNASITMRNTGTSTWTRAAGYKLGAVGDEDKFRQDTRVWLPEGVSVPPNSTYTFNFTLTAPQTPGSHVTDWQMVHEGVRWFGEIVRKQVSVTEAGKRKIDPNTMDRKLLMGYQGWFNCPGDGANVGWRHWFYNNTPDVSNLSVDMWPDMSELEPDELYETPMKYRDDRTAALYSAWNEKTVMRHFKWMQDYDLDGVFLQRFLVTPKVLNDQVTRNVRSGAEKYGRVFAIMYDISGYDESRLVNDLINDWKGLVDNLQITSSPSYLRHKGKPVLVIWGLGFNKNPGTPAQALELIRYFKGQVTLMGGVNPNWLTLKKDTDIKTDKLWATVYRSFDIISPWTVGRYKLDNEVDAYMKNFIKPDLKEAKKFGKEYMPVIFPGFSFLNGDLERPKKRQLNEYPRRGGNFYWRQVYNAISAGCTMLYGAMFDEVDEATAMFKIVSKKEDLPVQLQNQLVYLNIDGNDLPSDYYLSLAGMAGKMLRREINLTPVPPAPLPPRPPRQR